MYTYDQYMYSLLFDVSMFRCFDVCLIAFDSKKLKSLEKAVERQQQQVEETRSHVLKIQGVCDELRAGENNYGKIMHQMHAQNSQDTKESLAHVTTVEKDVRIVARVFVVELVGLLVSCNGACWLFCVTWWSLFHCWVSFMRWSLLSYWVLLWVCFSL